MPAQITPLSAPPTRADPVSFAERADTFLSELPTLAVEMNAAIVEINSNTLTAVASASTATTAAGTATAAAGTATAAANEAAGLTENYQGALALDPALDKSGNPLTEGDWYVNTTTGSIRAYTGSTWVNAVSAVAGVTDFNGRTGSVTGVDSFNGQTGPITGVSSVNGQVGDVNLNLSNIGDTLTTANILQAPTWLPANGSRYLKSSYPELGEKLHGLLELPSKGVSLTTVGAGNRLAAAFSDDGSMLAVSSAGPHLQIYSHSNASSYIAGTVTGTLPTSDSLCLAWGGDYLAVGTPGAAVLYIYKRVAGGISFVTNPPGVNSCQGIAWDISGEYLAVKYANSAPFFAVFKRTGDSFSKLTITTPPPVAATESPIAWGGAQNHLAVATNPTSSSVWVNVYKQESDDLVLVQSLPMPDGLTATVPLVILWGANGSLVVITYINSVSYIHVFDYSAGTYSYNPQRTLATPLYITQAAFDSSGRYLFCVSVQSPFLCVFECTAFGTRQVTGFVDEGGTLPATTGPVAVNPVYPSLYLGGSSQSIGFPLYKYDQTSTFITPKAPSVTGLNTYIKATND